MPAVPSTNICHVIYELGITLCPIYYILCYVDGLAILSNRPDLQSGHVARSNARAHASVYEVRVTFFVSSLIMCTLRRIEFNRRFPRTEPPLFCIATRLRLI